MGTTDMSSVEMAFFNPDGILLMKIFYIPPVWLCWGQERGWHRDWGLPGDHGDMSTHLLGGSLRTFWFNVSVFMVFS